MEHRFDGPRYTVGIEEELMIVDSSSLDLVNAIDSIVGEDPPSGQIQPELLESVLEIATSPCANVRAAGEELRSLRALARQRAQEKGLEIGSAGTHPFAKWEDQRVVGDDRYRGLIRSLGFVARQELVFGMHVHVGMADPEETIYVANGLRPFVPLLIALSANSPLWRGELTGLMSSRVPIFRAFPRVGLPPRFEGWADFERRVEAMSSSGLIEDYTYLWYDVRPHPRLGTVEVRAMDSQTRVEHTVALSALVVSLVRLLVESFHQDVRQPEPHWEILDENRWLAARHGLAAELYDQADGERRGVRELGEQLLEALKPHAQELGCERELEGVRDLLEAGNGAARQRMVYEANHDLRELMAEIVATTTGGGE
ncbi:MAG TPA: YbdK family carboxylate-amine ligase [Solirubrobacteraceae bacterium]|nr:YbdK family carboxylate-amine ligase [Solirubrobacteraceae bacterium]